MPRIRSIKPESCVSETLADLSDQACLLFAYLPCFCDDEGRMQYSSRLVKAKVFPMRDHITCETCESLVGELVTAGLVTIYEAEGRRILQVVGFMEHQRPQKPTPSEFPPPPEWAHAACRPAGSPSEDDAETAGGDSDGESVALQEDYGSATVAVNYDNDSSICCNSNRVGNGVGRVGGRESNGDKTSPPADAPKVSIEQIRPIVDYLNSKTGKNYKPNSSSTQRLIRARIKEGFTYADFVKVIDVKLAEWGRKPPPGQRDMRGYLRPETLFGTKFESYLNEWSPELAACGKGGDYAKYD